MTQFVDNQWFEVTTCCSCGIAFGLPTDFLNKRRQDGKQFYCPNNHSLVYRETELDKTKKQLERERQMREAADAKAVKAEREATTISKAHRKMRVRVMNGVCPCCNRSFENLRRHMHTEHPEFDKHRTLAALRQAFGMTQAAVASEAGIAAPHVSLYEHGKAISARAAQRIEAWIERHEASAP